MRTNNFYSCGEHFKSIAIIEETGRVIQTDRQYFVNQLRNRMINQVHGDVNALVGEPTHKTNKRARVQIPSGANICEYVPFDIKIAG